MFCLMPGNLSEMHARQAADLSGIKLWKASSLCIARATLVRPGTFRGRCQFPEPVMNLRRDSATAMAGLFRALPCRPQERQASWRLRLALAAYAWPEQQQQHGPAQ
jgi:hypothetical protein